MYLPVFACKLAGQPEVVVLLGPVEIDLAGAHGLERAFHPKRADIDVRKDHGDEQNGYDGVDDLRHLHVGDIGSVERKQQDTARRGDREASQQRNPVDALLTQIEAAGRSMLVLDEATAL